MREEIDDDVLINVKLDLGDDENVAVVVEEKVEDPLPWYIINASSIWRLRWDLYIILLVIYNCISIPLEIGFPESAES